MYKHAKYHWIIAVANRSELVSSVITLTILTRAVMQLTCGRQITWRHDTVVDSVATAFRQCGAQVRVEQTSDEPNSKQRPEH